MTVRGPYEVIHYYTGLSTDTKPTINVVLGDRYFETDSGLWYIYDSSSWSLLSKESGATLFGTCSSSMTASTTTLVVPDLVGFGDDFFNTKFYVQIIRNTNSVGNAPELQVRQITDYVSSTGTFTTSAFGANVEAGDNIAVLHESVVLLGRDDSDNAFASTNVGANADGSVLERLEWIQVAIGSAAGQLRTITSESQVIEENGILHFNIGIFDIDAGAIASANIDITGISAVMEKSTGGGAFSSVGITQPTFAKADGSVYCSYQFLAAEWQTGDMYKLVVTGITATIHAVTAYVPTSVWSNVIVETEDIKNDVQYLYAVADGGTTSPTKVIDNSILSIIMTKDSGGDTSDFDNSTDSLEAQSDKLGAYTGDGGTDQGDSVKANQDIIITDTEKVYDVALGVAPTDGSLASFIATGGTALGTRLPVSTSLYDTVKNINTVGITSTPVANTLSDILHKDGSFTFDNTTDSLEAISDTVTANTSTTLAGRTQIATTTEDLNQAAGTYDLLTGTTQPVLLEALSLKMPAVDISGGSLTYVTLQTDDATAQTIFDSSVGALANLTSEAELSWTGCVRINVGTKLTLTIAGGAAGSTCAAIITAKYRAITSGGTLA